MTEPEKIFDILYEIYNKHRRQHPENHFNSKQMCLMWSTDDPPDEIEGTEPFDDIEEAFKITIDDEDAFKLYDMTLEEASIRILEMQDQRDCIQHDQTQYNEKKRQTDD